MQTQYIEIHLMQNESFHLGIEYLSLGEKCAQILTSSLSLACNSQ